MASIYCRLTEDANGSCGWLGGNPPEWFDGKADKINDSASRYGFYCTFTLADKSKSLSIFLLTKDGYKIWG